MSNLKHDIDMLGHVEGLKRDIQIFLLELGKVYLFFTGAAYVLFNYSNFVDEFLSFFPGNTLFVVFLGLFVYVSSKFLAEFVWILYDTGRYISKKLRLR